MIAAAVVGNRMAGIYWSQTRFAAIALLTAALCALGYWLSNNHTPLWIRIVAFFASLALPVLAARWQLLRTVAKGNIDNLFRALRKAHQR